MSRLYRVHEFAELAGVTIKALHHYDRLGLLRPSRTRGGYRLYTVRDLERLEQILALKFLGLPLKQIHAVLNRPALELRQTLRVQRAALEEKQQILGRAIRAIQTAEAALESGQLADPALLKPIIEAIDMRDSIEAMKKYYSEEAWVKQRPRYEQGPSPAWQDLYRQIGALLGGDPAGAQAVALAGRWLELAETDDILDPDVLVGRAEAWQDREHWPPVLKQEVVQFRLEEVYAFMGKALLARQKKYPGEPYWIRRDRRLQALVGWHEWFLEVRTAFTGSPADAEGTLARWAEFIHRNPRVDREVQDRSIQAREERQQANRRDCEDLCRAADSLLGDDAESGRAQQLAERWLGFWERYLCGDLGVRAAWNEACPAAKRETIADFLGLAIVQPLRRYYPAAAWRDWVARRKQVPNESRLAAARANCAAPRTGVRGRPGSRRRKGAGIGAPMVECPRRRCGRR